MHSSVTQFRFVAGKVKRNQLVKVFMLDTGRKANSSASNKASADENVIVPGTNKTKMQGRLKKTPPCRTNNLDCKKRPWTTADFYFFLVQCYVILHCVFCCFYLYFLAKICPSLWYKQKWSLSCVWYSFKGFDVLIVLYCLCVSSLIPLITVFCRIYLLRCESWHI